MFPQSRIKILYVISGIDYALGFDWLDQFTDHSKYELSFVFLNSTEPELHRIIEKRGRSSVWLAYHSKKDIPKTIFFLYRLISKMKPHWVHAHLFDANLTAIPAAWLAGVKGRTYTRHHSSVHHVYHPRVVMADRIVNYLSTKIVSISENVSEVLIDREGVPQHKIKLIHHGFDLAKFESPSTDAIQQLELKYNPAEKSPVVGVISRYTHWKGIQYIIPAFKKLLTIFPDALLILANAKGDYADEIKSLLNELPRDSYCEIPFEKDLFSLYALFDIFIHVPVDATAEAYGQIYVEALAAGVPSVFTLSGIAGEFIADRNNALVVPFCDSNAIFSAASELLADAGLRNSLIQKGRSDVQNLFPVQRMIRELDELYSEQ